MAVKQGISRTAASCAFDGKLLFATVREDPTIELGLLEPWRPGRLVVVGSAGCTALSLLAQGSCDIVAVDSNRTQNHLIELKAAALATLPGELVPAFLGGHEMPPRRRRALLATVSPWLSPVASAFWHERTKWVERGVLRSGATERFIDVIRRLITAFVQPRRTIQRVLSATSLDEQRTLYDTHWNNRRWRALFHLALNRFVMGKALDERLFFQSDVRSVAEHFLSRFEAGLCEIPVADNYFLHHLLTGYYQAGDAGALPPYLARRPSESALRERLRLVDGSMTSYLRACPTASVRGFALSNICEWLNERDLLELFSELTRVATDNARIVLRNFLGTTEIPAPLRSVLREQSSGSAQLMASERSLMQRRILALRVDKSAAGNARQGAQRGN